MNPPIGTSAEQIGPGMLENQITHRGHPTARSFPTPSNPQRTICSTDPGVGHPVLQTQQKNPHCPACEADNWGFFAVRSWTIRGGVTASLLGFIIRSNDREHSPDSAGGYNHLHTFIGKFPFLIAPRPQTVRSAAPRAFSLGYLLFGIPTVSYFIP